LILSFSKNNRKIENKIEANQRTPEANHTFLP